MAEGPEAALSRVGIRELRNQVAAVVRRAARGERLVITVDGVATAQLGPLTPTGDGSVTLDDLVAAGLAQAPARLDRPWSPPEAPEAPQAEDVPVDIRPDDALDDLRGR